MAKHKNIPIFIPHLGCGNACVFCSQVKITGVERAEPELCAEIKRIRQIIESSLETLSDSEAEIAFFGGSFTGIGEERMIAMLECANEYLGGKIKGIRCSTRPDYINEHICEILKKYNVTSVELGIQSTDDRVLSASKRGHTSCVSFSSCKMLKDYGFELGGQMMIGLPCSTPESEVKTARDICLMGADTCRIYPTVVFENTGLYDMTLNGSYVPLTNEEAAVRSAECAKIFISHGVEILRIGLHASENLSETRFGANHPAMGELVEGEIYFSRLRELAEKEAGKEKIVFEIPNGEMSKCVGHHGKNRERLEKIFGKEFIFKENSELKKYDVRIRV